MMMMCWVGRKTLTQQALLCSIELGSIKCNLEMAKIGILSWENMSTKMAILPSTKSKLISYTSVWVCVTICGKICPPQWQN